MISSQSKLTTGSNSCPTLSIPACQNKARSGQAFAQEGSCLQTLGNWLFLLWGPLILQFEGEAYIPCLVRLLPNAGGRQRPVLGALSPIQLPVSLPFVKAK